MKNIFEKSIFIIPILVLIYLLYYHYNEFTISQSVLIAIFIVTQYYQIRNFQKQIDNQTKLLSKQIKQDIFYKKRFEAIALVFQSVLELNSNADELVKPLFNKEPEEVVKDTIGSYWRFVSNHSLHELYLTKEQNDMVSKYTNTVRPIISSCIAHGHKSIYDYYKVIDKELPNMRDSLSEVFKKSLHTETIEE
jgi:hypothetical protein